MTRQNVENAFTTLHSKSLTSHDKATIWANIEDQMSTLPHPIRNRRQAFRFMKPVAAYASAAVVFASIITGESYQYLHSKGTTPTVNESQHVPTNIMGNTLTKDHLPAIQYNDSLKSWDGIPVAPYPDMEGKTRWQITSSMAMPLSPDFQNGVLEVPHTEIQSLSDTRAIAGFPIREPNGIKGWTNTFSEGVELPIAQNVKGKIVGYKHTPAHYYDIYKSPSGQEISVTQTTDTFLTQVFKLMKEKNPPYWVKASKPTIQFHDGSHILGGFPSDLAIVYEDTKDSMKELTVYEEEQNGSVVILTVDGTTSVPVLASVAKLYLAAPSG